MYIMKTMDENPLVYRYGRIEFGLFLHRLYEAFTESSMEFKDVFHDYDEYWDSGIIPTDLKTAKNYRRVA